MLLLVAFLIQNPLKRNYQMDLGIVLMLSCGSNICCHDREDSDTCFEDEHSNALVCLYIELTSAKNVNSVWCSWQKFAQHPVLLGFPTEVCKACGDLMFQDCAGLGPI